MTLEPICEWWNRTGLWLILKFFSRKTVYRIREGATFDTAEPGKIIAAFYVRDDDGTVVGMTLHWQDKYMERWGGHMAISLKSIRFDRKNREFVFDQ